MSDLAALVREPGAHAEAANHWRAVLAGCPDDKQALLRHLRP
jgi:hypothetical protein